MTLASTASFATVYRTIGLTLFAVVLVATIVYVLVNVLFSGKDQKAENVRLQGLGDQLRVGLQPGLRGGQLGESWVLREELENRGEHRAE